MFTSQAHAENKAYYAEQDENMRFRGGYVAQMTSTWTKEKYPMEAFINYQEEKALSLASTSREADREVEQKLAQLRVQHELEVEAMVQGGRHSYLDRELEQESKGQDFIDQEGQRGRASSERNWNSLPLGTQLGEKLVGAAESASRIPGVSDAVSNIGRAAMAKGVEKVRETVLALHRIEFTNRFPEKMSIYDLPDYSEYKDNVATASFRMGNVIDSYKKDTGFESEIDSQNDPDTIKANCFQERPKPSKNELWNNEDKSNTPEGEIQRDAVPAEDFSVNNERPTLRHAEVLTPEFLRQLDIILEIFEDEKNVKQSSGAFQDQPNTNSSSN